MVEHCSQVASKSICTIDAVTSSAAGKGFMGGKHVTTMNQTERIGQLVQTLIAGTHRDVSQCFPSRCLALLDQVSSEMPGPPAGTKQGKPLDTECDTLTLVFSEPLGTGVGTHTVPLCCALAVNLNRYLKSLRSKRNTERAALRGQERKIGVEKKVNT